MSKCCNDQSITDDDMIAIYHKYTIYCCEGRHCMIVVAQNVNVLVIYPGGDTNEMHKRYTVETAENIM